MESEISNLLGLNNDKDGIDDLDGLCVSRGVFTRADN